jgi:hypothetical protein
MCPDPFVLRSLVDREVRVVGDGDCVAVVVGVGRERSDRTVMHRRLTVPAPQPASGFSRVDIDLTGVVAVHEVVDQVFLRAPAQASTQWRGFVGADCACGFGNQHVVVPGLVEATEVGPRLLLVVGAGATDG